MNTKDSIKYHNDVLEVEAKDYITQYDFANNVMPLYNKDLKYEIINSNFSNEEVNNAIDYLKNNKSPGIDKFHAEFIKSSKKELLQWITLVLNYIIEVKDFPSDWAEGLRIPVPKPGITNSTDNFRGITILPIFEKIFEIITYKRLSFVNEAFGTIDMFNGGFLNDSRTVDNLFILNGLAEKQLITGQKLYICFVDFSKAFDLVNRDILFYKLMKIGWKGRVIDTLRSLYAKTNFRLKFQNKLSETIPCRSGVNQGGVLSGLLF